MTKISIVIPVYNVNSYIDKCLRSVTAQTFTEWECIIVDDGSTDGSGIICDAYADKDNRFKVIHQENSGVSKARNKGLEIINGDWVCFLDSDDWWEDCFLQNFINVLSDEYQLFMQGFIVEDLIRNRRKKVGLPLKKYNSNAEIVKFLEETPNVHNGFLWHRLFSVAIIKNYKINFPEDITFAEDGYFFFDYLKYVQCALSVKEIGYHYILRPQSLTSTGRIKSVITYSNLLRHYVKTLYEFDVPDCDRKEYVCFVRRYACRLMAGWFIENAINRVDEREDFLNELLAIHNDYSILDVNRIPFSERLMIIAVSYRCIRFRNVLLSIAVKLNKWELRIKRNLRLFKINRL